MTKKELEKVEASRPGTSQSTSTSQQIQKLGTTPPLLPEKELLSESAEPETTETTPLLPEKELLSESAEPETTETTPLLQPEEPTHTANSEPTETNSQNSSCSPCCTIL